MLNQFIVEIGNKHGADKRHFKHERRAEALPPPYYIQPGEPNKYGLRLYCIRLTTEVVILLNGDLKTDDDPEKCNNCKNHFKLANKLSKKIDDAIEKGFIKLSGKQIIIDNNFDLTI